MKWKFTNVHHSFRLKAGLTFNEYGVLDVIYQGQSNPLTSDGGWVETPYKEIGSFLGLSVGAVKGILDRMQSLGLLEMSENKRRKRTTEVWYKNAYTDNDEETDEAAKRIADARKVQKLNFQKKQSKVQKLNDKSSETERKSSETEHDTLVYKAYKEYSNNVGQPDDTPKKDTLEKIVDPFCDGWENGEQNLERETFDQEAINDYISNEENPSIVLIGQKEKKKKKKIPPKKKKGNHAQVTEIVNYLNQAGNREFQPTTKETVKLITARLKKNTMHDLKNVIDLKCRDWLGDEKMCEYLRPSTLFNESKFETYHQKVKALQNGTYPIAKYANGKRNNGHHLDPVRTTYMESLLDD